MTAPLTVPAGPDAAAPPEVEAGSRDAVRMLVARRRDGSVVHAAFRDLPSLLSPGDLVVVNTSATRPGAVPGRDPATGREVLLHLSTDLGGDRWSVEPRLPAGAGSAPWPGDVRAPSRVDLVGGVSAHLLGPYRGSRRLWLARLVPGAGAAWLAAYGRPVRYRHATRSWPLSAYQTVYATEAGSAEMPSAGRPFTTELITRLVAAGVGVTPLALHCGVASLDAGEAPYPERLRVPAFTADRVNATRAAGGTVVAVGTTVVRALESAVDPATGRLAPLDGWTDLVITPEREVAAVDGLLTGWHEPEASHLLMLEAVAGRELLISSYRAAAVRGYRWHEFGDVHLILP